MSRIDELIGDAVEGLLRSHHRRRLHRLGHAAALQPPTGEWVAGPIPAREGNDIEVLVDGARALPSIAAEIRAATKSVHVANWHLSADFEPVRDGSGCTIQRLLSRRAEDIPVRALLWGGIPGPIGRKSRKRARRLRRAFESSGRVEVVLDTHERPLHCHHEKLVIIDDRIAFVGGIDFTDLDGDRFDTQDHPVRDGVGWHDVMTRLEGPIVGDLVAHFGFRWKEITGERLPPAVAPAPAGNVRAQIVRTIPERIYAGSPRGEFGILESYVRALRAAQRFIYLENQYLWSPEVVDVLRAKLERPPSEEFRVLIVLPAKANTGSDNTRGQLGLLAESDGGRRRLLACSISPGGHPVYVHAKIAIVDDRWMTIGSANLNEHSLFNDTEVNISVWDGDLARRTRRMLWAEHLETTPGALIASPTRVIDECWWPVAEDQLRRGHQGIRTHRVIRLEHVSRRSDRLVGPLQSLFVDG